MDVDEDLFLLVLWRHFVLVRCIAVLASVQSHLSIRRRNFLGRDALVSPVLSPLTHILRGGGDRDFLCCFGFDRGSFYDLVNTCETFDRNAYDPNRSLWLDQRIGLGLMWLNSSMQQKHLQLISGATAAVVCRALSSSMDLLHMATDQLPESNIRWPKPDEMEHCYQLILAKDDYIAQLPSKLFGWVDGCRIKIQSPHDARLNELWYSGYKRCHCTSNVLVWLPTGKCALAIVGFPGSYNDGRLASVLYSVLLNTQHTPREYGISSDTGFKRSGNLSTKIFAPLTERELARATSTMMERSRCITSLRQAVEWGMGTWQSTFRRLTSTLRFDTAFIKSIILLTIKLVNLRAEWMGISQIKTVFQTINELNQEADRYNVDRVVKLLNI
eukprot:TRINITY_DN8709_c0_g1_i1.p1 TRINITY_DN8709_c0_g1~~TRINITY_DN8709_c0_g1_i1.p1  ORF type:complete len:423 (-),score=-14.63 TRINITY_DN8709_c0_g1_i1:12-1169(-)